MFSILTRMVATVRFIHFMQIYICYSSAFSKIPGKEGKGSSQVEVTSLCAAIGRPIPLGHCTTQESCLASSGEKELRGLECVEERPLLS